MSKTDSHAPSELKTVGFTPFLYLSNQPLFHVCRDVPIADALAQASDLLFLAKSLTVDAAYAQDSDRHAWAAHYLTTMSKAVIDDVVKVLTRRPVQAATNAKD
ncbi:hypothetical protein PS726_05999 [Pseudomonas fluorescens]|uniref:DUF3077 domain-containing protein n=1 Tax=Pseudomonas fluorescens TaxID=294 RepID=A0A8H2P509_PSEFL|nr:DUF3077 domain-containing protein [Pseudomonas fluorescens]CAG8869004.1 hypothetical protein PS861_02718 [Pseudomonas fluorescens]VVO42444.1 hypothetical protein PS726_05999 [Pseudomonas fluorescens]VVP37717.1 hypothetical protein PS900_04701 [Pseudomonas fluorescens]